MGNAKPVIPTKSGKETFPAMHTPPAGTRFVQMARDGNHWGVWEIVVKPGGTLEAEKVVESTTWDLARLEVGQRTVAAQAEALR